MDFTQHYMKCSDLKATYWMVGIALLGACVISFVWILLMRFLAGEQLLGETRQKHNFCL